MAKEASRDEMKSIQLSSQERKIIEVIRELEFGELRIVVTDRKPTRIEEIKKSIKL